jgi:hypothetical protein
MESYGGQASIVQDSWDSVLDRYTRCFPRPAAPSASCAIPGGGGLTRRPAAADVQPRARGDPVRHALRPGAQPPDPLQAAPRRHRPEVRRLPRAPSCLPAAVSAAQHWRGLAALARTVFAGPATSLLQNSVGWREVDLGRCRNAGNRARAGSRERRRLYHSAARAWLGRSRDGNPTECSRVRVSESARPDAAPAAAPQVCGDGVDAGVLQPRQGAHADHGHVARLPARPLWSAAAPHTHHGAGDSPPRPPPPCRRRVCARKRDKYYLAVPLSLYSSFTCSAIP